MTNRIPLMAGNWKMNLDHLEANHLVQGLAMALKDDDHDYAKCEVLVIPPFTDIRTVQTIVDADNLDIKYGAQDVSVHDNGAYTGEVSTAMLTKLGCTYVVMGHSERREYHSESDELVGAKARKVLDAGMTPILCCGEALEIRKAGTHVKFVLDQIRAALKGWSPADVARIVIAYEPIWAIGTGETATAADAQEVCNAIREALRADFGGTTADTTRILYGGSAKPGNIKELMTQPDVDGALVGGASLKADSFAAMANFSPGAPPAPGAPRRAPRAGGARAGPPGWRGARTRRRGSGADRVESGTDRVESGTDRAGDCPTRAPTGPRGRDTRREHSVTALRIILQVLLVLSSFFLIMSILLHKGKGGGLSDMFGGGISSSAGSSGVAERNLDRITVGVALLWTVTIVGLGLVARFS